MFNFFGQILRKIKKLKPKNNKISDYIMMDRKVAHNTYDFGGFDKYQYGYVNGRNKLVIPYKYDMAFPFTKDGVAWAYKKTKLVLLDINGNELFWRYKYPYFNDFNEGLCTVCDKENKWGAINMKGEEVIPFKYKTLYSFYNGYAVGRKEVWDVPNQSYFYKWGFIDKKGKEQLGGFIFFEMESLKTGEAIGTLNGSKVRVWVNNEGGLEMEDYHKTDNE